MRTSAIETASPRASGRSPTVKTRFAAADQDVGGSAADILPVARADAGLQLGAVKLAIAKQRHGRLGRDQLLEAANQRAMQLPRADGPFCP